MKRNNNKQSKTNLKNSLNSKNNNSKTNNKSMNSNVRNSNEIGFEDNCSDENVNSNDCK